MIVQVLGGQRDGQVMEVRDGTRSVCFAQAVSPPAVLLADETECVVPALHTVRCEVVQRWVRLTDEVRFRCVRRDERTVQVMAEEAALRWARDVTPEHATEFRWGHESARATEEAGWYTTAAVVQWLYWAAVWQG